MVAGNKLTNAVDPASAGETCEGELSELYLHDEVAWLEESARRIHQGRTDELDFPHLQEWLQDMALRERREVRHRLIQLLVHLLKWYYQPEKRTRSWERTVFDQRLRLDGLFKESTVLRRHAEEVLADVYPTAVTKAAKETNLPCDTFPEKCPYTAEDLFKVEYPG